MIVTAEEVLMPSSPLRFNKLLIVKPSSLGDIIHALPLLNAVKQARPDAEIDWVVARGFEGILRRHPMIGRLWIINKDDWKRPGRLVSTASEVVSLLRGLRSIGYDIAVDLQGLFRSAIIAALSGAPLKAGFSDARELSPLLYNLKVEGGMGVHAVDRYLRLASLIGIEAETVDFPLPPPAGDFHPGTPYYVVVPGARWPTKRWPVEYFVEVIRELPMTAVIVGGRDDLGIAEWIVSKTGDKAVNLAGRTDLGGLLSVIRGAAFMLSNDSGPMHAAAALSVPVYALFGPTSEILTGPYGDGHRVFRADVDCAPCFRRRCRTVKCMRDIQPAWIVEAALEDTASRV